MRIIRPCTRQAGIDAIRQFHAKLYSRRQDQALGFRLRSRRRFGGGIGKIEPECGFAQKLVTSRKRGPAIVLLSGSHDYVQLNPQWQLEIGIAQAHALILEGCARLTSA
jgi:hypothetical protein